MDTHNLICDFGRFKGERYTRLPPGYLKWMVNSGHDQAPIAKAELERRGIPEPNFDISSHALDRASEWLWYEWMDTRRAREGFYSWLCRRVETVLKLGARSREDPTRLSFGGYRWCFEFELAWPILKTVFPLKEDRRVEHPRDSKRGSVKKANPPRRKRNRSITDR